MEPDSSKNKYLAKRVSHLEEVNQKTQASLESIRTLTNFQKKIGTHHELSIIFKESIDRILNLIDFKAFAFFIYDKDTFDFVPKHVYPKFLAKDIQKEIDFQIEAGTFAWALNQNNPVIIKPLQLESDFELIFHSLSTENQVLGMFVGQLLGQRDQIYQEAFDLLSITLMTTSLAIENATLYQEIENYNQNLKRIVEKRTAELVRTINKLKIEIDDRKRAEVVLRESERRFRHLFENSPDAVFVEDFSGNVLAVNPAACRLHNIKREELIGKNVMELVPPDKREEVGTNFSKMEKSKQAYVESFSFTKEGKAIPVEIRASHINYAGKPSQLLHVRDITERKQAEVEIKKAKEAAEVANNAKSAFLANMSHEIRTPLNAIIGMTELALETDLSSDQREYINVVQSSSEGLLGLINELLDFSRIEAGQMELERIDFNLRKVVEGTAEIYSDRALAKNLELLCYIQPELPSWIAGDSTKLKQILVNLIGNAIKFTEKGEVAVTVERLNHQNGRRDKTNGVDLHFMVTDTGIGIAKENHQRIFEKFTQVDNSTTRKFGGTGLGLNISKSLIELMGGTIWVESKEEEGSTFHFKVTLSNGDDKSEEEDNSRRLDFNKINVLVVDDNETNRVIIIKTLKAWGFRVKEAESGSQALELLHNGQGPVDLIILDHQMPEMDGVEFARKLRGISKFKDIKIVMLSSIGILCTKMMRELDISEYITKPVKQSKLFNLIVRVLRRSKSNNNIHIVESMGKSTRKNNHRILLVEDNVDNQQLAKKVMEKAGYLVEIAENGQFAVEAARRFQYDLILMDVYMPVMDGFEATKKIREIERSRREERIPIIALTAHAIDGYREKCLRSDMDDYITKPLRKKVLFNTFEKWIDPRPTIIVVDDSVENQKMIKSTLKEDGGYRVVLAQNSQEAVDEYKRRTISLIMIDMEKPAIDGFSAVTAIRALERGKKVPIIALTTNREKRETKKCLKVGCTQDLSKPLGKEILLETLIQYLDNPVVEKLNTTVN